MDLQSSIYKCKDCGCDRDPIVKIVEEPEYIFIYIERQVSKDKVKYPVDFDGKQIEFSKYFSTEKEIKYSLHSVICHEDDPETKGYYSIQLKQQNGYLRCTSKITFVDDEDIKQLIEENSVLFIYSKNVYSQKVDETTKIPTRLRLSIGQNGATEQVLPTKTSSSPMPSPQFTSPTPVIPTPSSSPIASTSAPQTTGPTTFAQPTTSPTKSVPPATGPTTFAQSTTSPIKTNPQTTSTTTTTASAPTTSPTTSTVTTPPTTPSHINTKYVDSFSSVNSIAAFSFAGEYQSKANSPAVNEPVHNEPFNANSPAVKEPVHKEPSNVKSNVNPSSQKSILNQTTSITASQMSSKTVFKSKSVISDVATNDSFLDWVSHMEDFRPEVKTLILNALQSNDIKTFSIAITLDDIVAQLIADAGVKAIPIKTFRSKLAEVKLKRPDFVSVNSVFTNEEFPHWLRQVGLHPSDVESTIYILQENEIFTFNGASTNKDELESTGLPKTICLFLKRQLEEIENQQLNSTIQ
ncbi:hypothetical protein PPL_03701 [Heterostelium album PN500]|uniref:USP domain-containing protein n=1 Tax=Heterostelium pallidum (strain ATCC 26659 / Pp 5 / PN500) TaxID=670386 RepID=D3B6F3_HETP5|nr:hypothetical protein PPL_03701 [Heterostelium album PN500]EFA82923.1 hypothetical protein PPL_03701 [Heterostelium album PN500]|eukprot:XP_020435040.1 hypothetical protein PPL_03701 [Heterostelium album PN500]